MEDLKIEYTTKRNKDGKINKFRTVTITGEELIELLEKEGLLFHSINIVIGDEPDDYRYEFYGMKIE